MSKFKAKGFTFDFWCSIIIPILVGGIVYILVATILYGEDHMPPLFSYDSFVPELAFFATTITLLWISHCLLIVKDYVEDLRSRALDDEPKGY